MRMPTDMRSRLDELAHFPWKSTVLTLRERFREDRLGLTAGSLTFTTTIALVPLITVALAIFTVFPMFGKLQQVLQKWLVESLVPDAIARQVLGYLTLFAKQASQLGGVGLAILLGTTLALILTIDRTLNSIWRVKRKRRLAQRVLVYWSAITLGPLVLAASITMASYAVTVSRGLTGSAMGGVSLLLDALQFMILAGGAAAMYHYVPNARVKWSHAWVGGLFTSLAMELVKKLLVVYLAKVPSYSMVYGTFATVPILLVWIYLAWVIVLLGAVITAYLPSLLAGVVRRDAGAGWQFQLALETLRQLAQVRGAPARGLGVLQLAHALRTNAQSIESVLDVLSGLDWVARLDEAQQQDQDQPRYVLLVDPADAPLEPLVRKLLLPRNDSTAKVWDVTGVVGAKLGQVL